jgi:hypothetical protein
VKKYTRKEAKQRVMKALHGNWPDVIQSEFCLQYLRHHLDSSWGIIAYLIKHETKLKWHILKMRFSPKMKREIEDAIKDAKEEKCT